MDRKIIPLVLSSLFLATGIIGQINDTGNPFLKNFDPLEYSASEQNWSIVQDARGVMYFGNSDGGVLEFDGQNWRSIPVPNHRVHSLSIDERGTIFVGGVGELGFLAPDETGRLNYNSLTHLIDTDNKDFNEIYKIYTLDETVYFATLNRLYIYENNGFRVLRHRPEASAFFSFLVDEVLYWGTYNNGLMKMEGDSFTMVKNGEFFIYRNITTILPHDNEHLIIGTLYYGIYLYNKESGDISDELFSDHAQDYFKTHPVYHGTTMSGGHYGFATTSGGAVITDRQGTIINLLNSGAGLRDEQITSVYNNHTDGRESPLWLTMMNGIASVEFHNPLRSFSEADGLRGLILDVVRFNGTLFVATMAGVFYLDFGDDGFPVFRQIDEIRLPAFSLAVADLPGAGERLIIGTQGGVFEMDGSFALNSITSGFEEKSQDCRYLHPSRHHPGRIYLGLYDDAEYIEFKNSRWEYTPFRVNNQIISIDEDSIGNLWLGTLINGYIRIDFTENDTVRNYFDEENGLPEGLNNLFVQEYEGDLIFNTEKGILLFDAESGNFYPDKRFTNAFEDPESGVMIFDQDEDGVIWVSVTNDGIRWIQSINKGENGNLEPDPVPYRPFPALQCDVIYPDNSIVWFGISNRLYSFDKNTPRDYRKPFNVLIRKVTISQIDSVLFNGTNYRATEDGRLLVSHTQPDELMPRLKFALNRLEFEFASPYYDSQDKTQFSWFLEGEDMTWSNWGNETRAQYTYLREGSYTLRVRARNVYGLESSEAVYEFYISPPWHRTIAAYIGYLILLSLFIYAIVLFNSRRLKKEKIILEGIVRERTAEIMNQKEEIEAQRDKIAEQNKNITDSIEYARRIQTAILPPGDYVKELLPQRFILFLPRDIVSGDFYWLTKLNKRIISVAADCTGHGVPGGFMSMLGIAFLNEIVNKSPDNVAASEILDQLRNQVITSLHQTGKSGDSQDGMDISLFILDWENKSLEFAGANNPLIIIRNKKIIEIKGDKMPIGIHDRVDEPFTNHLVKLSDGDVIYTLSDGFQDQFGGPRGKKFMIKRLKHLLIDISDKPMSEQRDILLMELEEWQGSFEQVDDIIVMGVRI